MHYVIEYCPLLGSSAICIGFRRDKLSQNDVAFILNIALFKTPITKQLKKN